MLTFSNNCMIENKMIDKIQKAINEQKFDGWLFYNFRGLDPSADSILQIPDSIFSSRRWFYFIPRTGTPCKLVHKIEPETLTHLPGKDYFYAGWREMNEFLQEILSSVNNICMQYSPNAAIPYVSYIDAGTFELVKSMKVNIHSSANLIQLFEAVWEKESIASHNRSADFLRKTALEAFKHIRASINENKKITEYELQQFIVKKLTENDLEIDHDPIVGINENSGNPHHSPAQNCKRAIQENDIVLIDLWGKEKKSKSVYADITWMGYVGQTPPDKYKEVFSVVKNARDAAISFIHERFEQKKAVCGYEVDEVTRNVIKDAHYGEYFVHRTGHSIGADLHWKGVNLDNLETKDERQIIEGLGFSIEPGIYLPEFGVRLEVNGYIHGESLHISAQPIQENIILI